MAAQVENMEATAERMLAEAYELVYSGWCQGAPARDANGREIEPGSAFARSWSAPGALTRVWTRMHDRFEDSLPAFQRANLALTAVVGGAPQEWNDAEERTVREVLDALAEAVQTLAGESEVLDHVSPFAEAPAGS
jgi:hypothetical protein